MDASSCWRGLCPFPSAPQTISAVPDQLSVKKASQPAESEGIMTPCWSQGTRGSTVYHSRARLSRAMSGCPALLKVSVSTPLPSNLPVLTALWEQVLSCLANDSRANLPSWRKSLSPCSSSSSKLPEISVFMWDQHAGPDVFPLASERSEWQCIESLNILITQLCQLTRIH